MDIGKLSFQTEFNAVTRSLWGNTVEGEDSGMGTSFWELSNEIMRLIGKPNISDFFPVPTRFDIQGVEREIKKAFLFFDHIIERRTKQEREREKRALDNREV